MRYLSIYPNEETEADEKVFTTSTRDVVRQLNDAKAADRRQDAERARQEKAQAKDENARALREAREAREEKHGDKRHEDPEKEWKRLERNRKQAEKRRAKKLAAAGGAGAPNSSLFGFIFSPSI